MEKFNSLAGLLPLSILREGGEKKKKKHDQQLRSEKFHIGRSARLARSVETVQEELVQKKASCICGITKEDLFPRSTVTKSLPLV